MLFILALPIVSSQPLCFQIPKLIPSCYHSIAASITTLSRQPLSPSCSAESIGTMSPDQCLQVGLRESGHTAVQESGERFVGILLSVASERADIPALRYLWGR